MPQRVVRSFDGDWDKRFNALSWGTVFPGLLFTLFEILYGIFTRPDGGRYRANNKQHHDDNAPNALSAVLLHQPQQEDDEGYGEN